MRMKMLSAWSAAAIVATVAGEAQAAPTLHRMFQDHGVLQREIPLPVWGTAEPGEKVTVSIQDQKAEATAAADGKWSLKLPALKPGGPFELKVVGVAGGKTSEVVLKDVLVGDVWICSGQSNMEWGLQSSADGPKEVAEATHPNIRLLYIQKRISDAPESTIGDNDKWTACTPQTAGRFSAVGYYFGRKLNQDLKVPQGLINTNWGGTPAESWTSKETLTTDPTISKAYIERVARDDAAIKANRPKFGELSAKHNEAVKAAQAAKQKAPPPPPELQIFFNAHRPAGLYNGMIAPIIPYGIRGAIWYQGESNAGQAYFYRSLFTAMIKDWRKQWGQGDFGFYFVQLAPFQAISKDPQESNWAELREAQTMALKLPKTGMSVITDVGDEKDIHPRQKKPVGERLAIAAEAVDFGLKVEPLGPFYESLTIDGNKAVLSFKHVGGGLEARGGELTGFAICGEDKKWVWGNAKIEGDKVVVSHPDVAKPVAVRFGWAQYPVVNLWSKDGLPATPFRTDNFKGVTEPK